MVKKRALGILVLVLIASVLLTNFTIVKVNGSSMEPTYKDGELLLGSRFFHLEEQMIVIFEKDNESYLKRIISIDGNRVWIEGDNYQTSEDSRDFGWINSSRIKARVFPQRRKPYTTDDGVEY